MVSQQNRKVILGILLTSIFCIGSAILATYSTGPYGNYPNPGVHPGMIGPGSFNASGMANPQWDFPGTLNINNLNTNSLNVGNSVVTCDSSHRGTISYMPGTSGFADRLMVCIKDETDNYNWVDVTAKVGGYDWLEDFAYYRAITITNIGSALTDYQVLITLDTASLCSSGKLKNDCSDLRFANTDKTRLNYFVDSGCNSANTKIWVTVPSIPAGSKTIYVYYGNVLATDESKLWDNVRHLSVYGGAFDYNASLGVGSAYSMDLQHHLGLSVGGHTCILKTDGNVHCQGDNYYGQANDYNGGDAIGVSAGSYHTCILKSNGNVDCYGDNVGGSTKDYNGGDAIGVSAGNYHTCILKSNGNVDCYGDNDKGQANDYNGGDAIGVSAGNYHTCILKSNGNVDCYGDNDKGQANDYNGGDAIGISAAGGYFGSTTCILKSNGNVFCQGDNSYGQANDYHGGDAIGVSVGNYHTCILKSNGNVDCYGNNIDGSTKDYNGGDAIGVGVSYRQHYGWTCILKSNGNVDCYGNNNNGQANDYNGGDAYNPFRKYASPEPISIIGSEQLN